MSRIRNIKLDNGFALPAVLITSVIMMMLLLSSLTASTSTSVSLREQYKNRLLASAAESGLVMAEMCLDKNPDASWTELTPSTDCSGAQQVNCATDASNPRCSLMNSGEYMTSFKVNAANRTGPDVKISAQGILNEKRKSGGFVGTPRYLDRSLSISRTRLEKDSRATQRYWYVGESAGAGSARIDFGISGAPAPVIDSRQPAPEFNEGLTVVTDISGNLLFSTNGINAYDANHVMMPGSAGGLGATGSTAQGVVAFPINDGKYVIIGNSAGADGNNAANPGDYGLLKKSIVDMNARPSGGAVGDIVAGSLQTLSLTTLNAVADASNQIENEPNGTQNYTGQFMTAAPDGYGRGYWLVFATPGRPYFYAILFDNKGEVSRVARSSTPDNGPVPVCRIASNNAWRAAFGTMRFNSAYTKLALAVGTSGCESTDTTRKMPSTYNSAYKDAGWIYLRSFNNTTGRFGAAFSTLNSQQWYSGFCAQDAYRQSGYSVDFSPDENYIYSSTIYPGHLFRYRITGTDIANGTTGIGSTVQFIGRTGNWNGTFDAAYPRGGQVRRAPNGKMYIANQGSTAISVLNDPDDSSSNSYVAGSCNTSLRAANFSYNSFVLGTVGGASINSGLGLPDYVTQFVPRAIKY